MFQNLELREELMYFWTWRPNTLWISVFFNQFHLMECLGLWGWSSILCMSWIFIFVWFVWYYSRLKAQVGLSGTCMRQRQRETKKNPAMSSSGRFFLACLFLRSVFVTTTKIRQGSTEIPKMQYVVYGQPLKGTLFKKHILSNKNQ